MSNKDGGPAFPRIDVIEDFGNGFHGVQGTAGMTLRDYFASHAPFTLDDVPHHRSHKATRLGPLYSDPIPLAERLATLAKLRMEYADAMLAARESGDATLDK
jgi:hypothetical protein